MSCGHSSATPGCLSCGSDDVECVQAQPVLPPAKCSDDSNTKAEGPPGIQGDTGDTPEFTVGTVTEGAANVILTENTPTSYTVDFVLPQPPIDSVNTWTAVQTYEQQAVFELGLVTTGGTSTFGGTAFTVTPDSSFVGDVAVAGDVTVTGDLTASQNAVVTGDLTVGGTAFIGGVELDGQLSFGASAYTIIDPITAGEFPKGYVVLDSCNRPVIVPNRGGDLYQKEDMTGLTTITASTSGPVTAAAFYVAVPPSSCAPQVTPIVTVMARLAFAFGTVPVGAFSVKLRATSTSGTVLDTYTQGQVAFDNGAAGCVILEAQATQLVGYTMYFVTVDNGTNQDLVPTQLTMWATNR